jgi:type VI secretion system secreted protein VgrG
MNAPEPAEDNDTANESTSVGDGRTTWVVASSESPDVPKTIVVTALDEIVIRTGSASITLHKDGNIAIGGTQITIEALGDLVLKGQKILQS